jgi:hypothetical protein
MSVEGRLLELLVQRERGGSERVLAWLVDGVPPGPVGVDIGWYDRGLPI